MRTCLRCSLVFSFSLLFSLSFSLAAAPAQAQVAGAKLAINAQAFRPASGPDDVVTVFGTRTPGFLQPFANLLFEFAYQPLRLVQADGTVLAVPVKTMTTAHLMGGLGLTRFLAVSLDLPFVPAQTSELSSPLSPNQPLPIGLGDLRLMVKARILDNGERGGFGLAFVPQFGFPTGDATDFRGSSREDASVFTIEPRLALDYRLKHGVFFALNAGFLGRVCGGSTCDQIVYSARVSHLVTYGLGAYVPIKAGIGLGGEVAGATSIATADSGDRFSPLEGSLLLRWVHSSGVTLNLGGGGSFLQAAGSPRFRLFAGVGYLPLATSKPKPADRDHDGVPDSSDACPDEGGVASRDPQRNGCPAERDSDGDGVLDSVDQCPAVPTGEHPDPRKSGCPLTDKDGDGIFDDVDQCPDVAAGAHPDLKRSGCPLTDKDGDGIFDDVDQCPEVAAGSHPSSRKPGCPDVDSDGDGVFDSADQCPQEPAGLNPDRARPGCPLPDRDHDLVPDAADACPDQAGAPSPDPKKNGCPGIVEVRSGMILIKQEIFFATGKDVIQKKSFPVLQAVADTLAAVPLIKRVSIEGHTDNRGNRELNITLSDRRAQSVMRWLVEHSVGAARLEAHGYGPDRPIADNATRAGQSKNRRVDFLIIDPPQPRDAATLPTIQGASPDKPGATHRKSGKKGKGEE